MEFVMFAVMFVMFATGVALTVSYDRNGGPLCKWVTGYACGAVALAMFVAMVIVSNI